MATGSKKPTAFCGECIKTLEATDKLDLAQVWAAHKRLECKYKGYRVACYGPEEFKVIPIG